MKNSNHVYIFDTTLRDGEQAPGASMNEKEKLEVAFMLEKLGVDIIEAGFPVISDGDFKSVRDVAKHIKNSTICGLARCVKKDIDAVYEAVRGAKSGRIHVFLATSKIHMQYKLQKSPDEVLQMAIDGVKYAKSKLSDVEFSCEDATRSEPEFLYKIVEEVIKAGAKTVNIPDTVGYTMPEEFGRLISGIKHNVSNIEKAVISVHCHNDLGIGVANSLSAIKNGARQVECTINGIGERAGNASMEEIVMGLKTRKDIYGCTTRIHTPEFCRASKLVSRFTGFLVPPNKAIVGSNAFRHESGIHQDGVLKERTTYEIMRPEDVGFIGEGLVLGKHSGRHAFKTRLKSLGFTIDGEELDKAFERFKATADKKKQVFDEDLIAIVQDEVKVVQNVWQLESLSITSGTHVSPKAVVVLKSKGKKFESVSSGDGPVDSCYKAIDKITKMEGELLDYSIQSVTRGKDALGEVSIKVKFKGKKVIGHGASTDVIEASAKAYIDAINNVLSLDS